MKHKIHFFSLFMLFGTINSVAQYTSDTIKTPHGTPVRVWRFDVNGTDWTQSEQEYKDSLNQVKYHKPNNNNGITLVEPATQYYNCHAFAWGLEAKKFKMDADEVVNFINDYSYVQVVDSSLATIVVYGHPTEPVHSAVVTPRENDRWWFTSKWNMDGLYEHRKRNNPDGTHPTYWYAKLNIYFNSSSGSSTVCYNGSVFTLSYNPYKPNGIAIYWSVSDTTLFKLSNSSNVSTTVTRIGTGSGSATLKAHIGSPSGTVVVSTTISTCSLEVTGLNQIICGGNYFYTVPILSGATYSWENGGEMTVSSGGNSAAAIYNVPQGVSSGYDYIGCTITMNGVGYYVYKMVDIVCNSPSPSNVYPNPVKDNLTVEIDDRSSQRQAGSPTYNIRLYDGMGNLLRQTTTKSSTAQFNVNSLPNGVYYLHIYDGISATPEVQQIMVQH